MTQSPSRLRAIGELVALAGVCFSLVFVGMELSQNTAAVRGATYQALSDATADDLSAVAQNPQLAALLWRVYVEDVVATDFSPAENSQLYFYYTAFVRRLENSYLQFVAGVVDERVFTSYGWEDAILKKRHFRRYWYNTNRVAGGSEEFAHFLEERTDMAPSDEALE